MKQYEVDAATIVVRDAIIERMRKAGYGGFVHKVDEHKADLADIIQYGLQAAEDERKKHSITASFGGK